MVEMVQEINCIKCNSRKTGINRDSIYNKSNFYTDFVKMCTMELGAHIPENTESLLVMMYLIIC